MVFSCAPNFRAKASAKKQALKQKLAGAGAYHGVSLRLLLVDAQVDAQDVLPHAALGCVHVVKYDAHSTTLAELVALIREAHRQNGAPFLSMAIAQHGADEHGQWAWTSDLTVDLMNMHGAIDQLAPIVEVLAAALSKTKAGTAHIDLLACNLATTCKGLVPALEKMYGIDFRASTDETGNDLSGGDWKMETDNDYDVGADYLDAAKLKAYSETMARKAEAVVPWALPETGDLFARGTTAVVKTTAGATVYASSDAKDLNDVRPESMTGESTAGLTEVHWGTSKDAKKVPHGYAVVVANDVRSGHYWSLVSPDGGDSVTMNSTVWMRTGDLKLADCDRWTHEKAATQMEKAANRALHTATEAATERAVGLAKAGGLVLLDTFAGGAGTVIAIVLGGVDTANNLHNGVKNHTGLVESAHAARDVAATAGSIGKFHPAIGFVRDACGLAQLGYRSLRGNFDKNQLAKSEAGFLKVQLTINKIETLAKNTDDEDEVDRLHKLAATLTTGLKNCAYEVSNSEHYQAVHGLKVKLLGAQ